MPLPLLQPYQHIKNCIVPELLEKVQDFDIKQYAVENPSDRDFKKMGLSELVQEVTTDVFSFSFLTPDFCTALVETIEQHAQESKEGWEKEMMGSAILRSIKLERLSDRFVVNFVGYLDKAIYPLVVYLYDFGINAYEMPFVQKLQQKDKCLEAFMHDQASDVSLFIALNEDYEGGEIELLRQKWKVGNSLRAGTALLFPGRITHPYRVNSVTKGCKYLLTVWMTDGREKREKLLGWS